MKDCLDHNAILEHLSENADRHASPSCVGALIDLCELAKKKGENMGNGTYKVDLSVNDMSVELNYPRSRMSTLLAYAVGAGIVTRSSFGSGATSRKQTYFDLKKFDKEGD